MKQLLTDSVSYLKKTQTDILTENYKPGQILKVRTLLQRADVTNQNNRVYPKAVLEPRIEDYIETFVPDMSYGELDHPDSSVVEAKNASHTIDKIWWNKHEVWGDMEILPTPSGNIVAAIFNRGKTLGVSSRGLGSVEELEEGVVEVQPDFELLCWDVVTNPSVKGSRLDKIEESVIKEIGENAHYYDEVDKIIRDIICELTGECKLGK